MSDLLDISCIFFYLLIIGCIFSKKRVRIFFILVTLFYYLVGNGVVGTILVKLIEAKPTNINVCEKTKGIILLGGGVSKSLDGDLQPSTGAYDRILKTAEVYINYPQKIIISEGFSKNNLLSGAKVYAKDLYKLNIPKSDIILEEKSQNTFQNAKYVKEILGNNSNQYCLITDEAHLKRAQIYFDKFNIKTISLASSKLTPRLKLPRAGNFYVTKRIIHEYLGLVKAYFQILF